MNNIIMETMDNISYEDWVFPGVVMIINTIIIAPIIFRDFYYSRLESKTLVTLSLTPLSKFQIISYLIISATVEGLVLSLLPFFILLYLMELAIGITSFIYIILAAFIFNIIIGNALATLSLSSNKINTILVSASIMLLFIFYSSQLLIEFEFYPASIIDIFNLLPTTMILNWYRSVEFEGVFNINSFFIPLAIGFVWLYINSILIKRVFSQ